VAVPRIASEAAHERYRDSHQSTENYSDVYSRMEQPW
jgi:hypothetical protein